MDHYDIRQIRDMFPCLIRYLPNEFGYLMENLSVYRFERDKYSHYIEFVMMEENRLYENAFDTVALRIYFRKSRDGTIKYKHKRFAFIPEKGFYLANENIHRKYEELFMDWWQTVLYVLYSKYHAEKNLSLFREELLATTFKPCFD